MDAFDDLGSRVIGVTFSDSSPSPHWHGDRLFEDAVEAGVRSVIGRANSDLASNPSGGAWTGCGMTAIVFFGLPFVGLGLEDIVSGARRTPCRSPDESSAGDGPHEKCVSAVLAPVVGVDMAVGAAVGLGRDAFRGQAWVDAYTQLSVADQEGSLGVEDLERLAMAAHLLGRDDESASLWTRAHRACLRRGDTARASRCAFWLAFELLHRGQSARGSGWVTRTQRLIDEEQLDCVERGYLDFLAALGCAFAGEWRTAYAGFDQSTATGVRFGDVDLVTLGRQGQGRRVDLPWRHRQRHDVAR